MTNKEPRRKISQSDITRAIEVICEENESKQFKLITVSELRNVLEYDVGKKVTRQTLRDHGVSKSGYYEKAYPDVFAWNDARNPRKIGLIVRPQKFLDEIEVDTK